MEELENNEHEKGREEIFSKTVRAGKRTYFFDVKSTRSDEFYLTITESKRRFNNDQGKFFYEKHKLFLYKEDFEKFTNGLNTAIEFILTGKAPEEPEEETTTHSSEYPHAAVDFEDLGSDTESSETLEDSESVKKEKEN
ncbi:MAG: DUF3276 family protein [Bacteroidales bacterium]|nr:DUF3276 family protein [Bacteroidales bacterium]